MIPESYLFDQSTIMNIIDSDEVVQEYRTLFSLGRPGLSSNDGKPNVQAKALMVIQWLPTSKRFLCASTKTLSIQVVCEIF